MDYQNRYVDTVAIIKAAGASSISEAFQNRTPSVAISHHIISSSTPDAIVAHEDAKSELAIIASISPLIDDESSQRLRFAKKRILR